MSCPLHSSPSLDNISHTPCTNHLLTSGDGLRCVRALTSLRDLTLDTLIYTQVGKLLESSTLTGVLQQAGTGWCCCPPSRQHFVHAKVMCVGVQQAPVPAHVQTIIGEFVELSLLTRLSSLRFITVGDQTTY
jgi:hypothetical protein